MPSDRRARQRIAVASPRVQRWGERRRLHVARQSAARAPELTQETQCPRHQRGRGDPGALRTLGTWRGRERVAPCGPSGMKGNPRLAAAASTLTKDVTTASADRNVLRHKGRRPQAETLGRKARLVRRGTARIPRSGAARGVVSGFGTRAGPTTDRQGLDAGGGRRRDLAAGGTGQQALPSQREARQARLP